MTNEFIERRQPSLTEEEIEEIAERAAEKAIGKMETRLYTEVGKSFINKFTKIIGFVVLGLAIYFSRGDITKVF